MRSAAVAQQLAGSSSFLILEIDLNYFIFTARSGLARPSSFMSKRAANGHLRTRWRSAGCPVGGYAGTGGGGAATFFEHMYLR